MGAGHILKEMFVAFGKPIVGSLPQKRLDVYKNWADKCSEGTLSKVVDKAINNEERFPTIAKMNVLLHEVKSNRLQYSDDSIKKCYFCDGTGFVPYMETPEFDKNGSLIRESDRYVIRNYACKCSKGESVSTPSNAFPKPINKYFDNFDEAQMEEEKDKYPSHIAYPLLVHMIARQKNQILLGK